MNKVEKFEIESQEELRKQIADLQQRLMKAVYLEICNELIEIENEPDSVVKKIKMEFLICKAIDAPLDGILKRGFLPALCVKNEKLREKLTSENKEG